jgi:hypothetical protein
MRTGAIGKASAYGFDPVRNCGYGSLHIGEPPIIYSKIIVSINA